MRPKFESPDEIPNYMDALRLEGQGFVVLGAGQGMGAQSAHALSQAGAQLLLVDNDQARADSIAQATGGTPIVANATDRSEVQRVFATADRLFGDRFSGLVDIIGVAANTPIVDITDEEWSFEFDIVVRHALYAMQAAMPLLARNGGGAMTFIGSISGNVAIANQGAYGSAKAALHHLVRLAALEFGPSQVRVNAIAPGFVRTPRLNARMPQYTWDQIGEANWLKRAAVPADIARVVLFLSSDLSRYVNGNVLTLDGGVSHGVPLSVPKI